MNFMSAEEAAEEVTALPESSKPAQRENRLSKYSTYDVDNQHHEATEAAYNFNEEAAGVDEQRDLAYTARQPQH